MLALSRLFDRALSRRLGAQSAKVIAWIIALGYAGAMLAVGRTSGAMTGTMIVDALAWLSWLSAGLAAISIAGSVRGNPDHAALAALACQRGYERKMAAHGMALGAMRRIARLTAIPGLLLALLGLALTDTLALLPSRLLLCAAVVGYGAVVGLLVGGLAYLAARWAPTWPRLMLLLLLFVPHAARILFPELPSVPWALGWLLGGLSSLGAGA